MTSFLAIAISLATLPWPFQMGGDLERVQRGFGDYNSGPTRAQFDEFHPGIDVLPPTESSVIQLPYSSDNIIAECRYVASNTWSILIADEYPGTGNSYLYNHVYGLYNAYSKGDTLAQLSQCADPPSNGYRHVHISVYDPALWGTGPGGIVPEPGISNIINEFNFTDQVKFREVYNDRVIAFYREDGTGYFEDIIRGAVDFVVSPRSIVPGHEDEDSCGVLSIGINSIARQNPFTEQYSSIPYYPARTVFDWSQELVDCICTPAPDEYFYLYNGGVNPPTYFTSTGFNCNYHITNSATNDPGTYGINNIWTSGYDSQADFNDDIRCRGAWDTILKVLWTTGADNQSACENSAACFPDGRYQVNVTATSQTGNSDTEAFPEGGVIVDNFVPFIDAVIVYSTYSGTIVNTIYTGRWISTSNVARELSQEINGYLLPENIGKSSLETLGVAIHFSEPMKESNLPSVWLEGEWGGGLRWTSLLDRRLWFFPCDLSPELIARLAPESDEYGEWRCYQTREYEYPGYVGSLTLNIGHAPLQTPGTNTNMGTDLAGNLLDVFPAVIKPPLSMQTQILEPNVDGSHSYGSAPLYPNVSNMYPPYPTNISTSGHVLSEDDPGDTLYHVNLGISQEYLSLCTNYLGSGRYDCPYYHGYWIIGRDLEFQQILGLVHGDESTSFIVRNLGFTGFNYFSQNGDFLLNTAYDSEVYQVHHFWRTFYVYILSREFSYPVYNSYLMEGPLYSCPPWNHTEITDVEWLTDCKVRVSYWVATDISGGGYSGYEDYDLPDLSSPSEASDSTACSSSEISALSEELQLGLSLSQNPSASSPNISITSPCEGHATVKVYDLSGRLVNTLLNEEIHVGTCIVNWDTQNMSNGVYFLLLETPGGNIATQAMVIH